MRSTLAWMAAAAWAAGCTIVTPSTGYGPGTLQGSGGGGGSSSMPFVNGQPSTSASTATSAGATSGTSGGLGGAALGVPLTSYEYLCGGSQATCLPGATTDLCAPGGSPGLGGGSPGNSTFSCQLVPGDGGVAAVCNNSGAGRTGDACQAASDCGAELGCVTIDGVSTCRPYCCDGLETCSAETYCLASPMAGAPANVIPVCVPVVPCTLLTTGDCTDGMACAIVRESGTTSCVTPGAGTTGQACPCAAGYTCSFVEGTCVELCHTQGAEDDCGDAGYCQGGIKAYPASVGYCVSY